jgi:hypothetical protein
MWSAFAERLDAHLCGQERQVSATSQVATPPWIGPVVPWFPGAARFRAGSGASRALPPVVATTRSRRLTATERAALDLLARASACALDSSFDSRLLRRAFRTAARRLHPDAHPAAGRAERERLGAAFAAARAAYLTLLPLSHERPRG